MTNPNELESLGRRQGALWAVQVIMDACKGDGAIKAGTKVEHVVTYATTLSQLQAAGVDRDGVTTFTKAADAEMAWRFDLFGRAVAL